MQESWNVVIQMQRTRGFDSGCCSFLTAAREESYGVSLDDRWIEEIVARTVRRCSSTDAWLGAVFKPGSAAQPQPCMPKTVN